jgi:transposase
METVRIGRRRRPNAVAGDRGYSYLSVRTWLAERGIKAVIPTRSNQRTLKLDCEQYRRRNVAERCIGWLKCCRRIATRYEKLAIHFLGMVKLAMIQRCLRVLDLSNRTWSLLLESGPSPIDVENCGEHPGPLRRIQVQCQSPRASRQRGGLGFCQNLPWRKCVVAVATAFAYSSGTNGPLAQLASALA